MNCLGNILQLGNAIYHALRKCSQTSTGSQCYLRTYLPDHFGRSSEHF